MFCKMLLAQKHNTVYSPVDVHCMIKDKNKLYKL